MTSVINMVNKVFKIHIENTDSDEFVLRIVNCDKVIMRMAISSTELKAIRDELSSVLNCDCDNKCYCDMQQYSSSYTTSIPKIHTLRTTAAEIKKYDTVLPPPPLESTPTNNNNKNSSNDITVSVIS